MKYENEKLMEEILQRGGNVIKRRRKQTRRYIALGVAVFLLWSVLLSLRVTGITPSGPGGERFSQLIDARQESGPGGNPSGVDTDNPSGVDTENPLGTDTENPPGTDPGELPGSQPPPGIDVGAWVPPGVGNASGNRKTFLEDSLAVDEAARSVVKLTVYDRNGDRIATGSGFCAYDRTILVTAAHVITNMDYMIAEKDDGSTFRIEHVIEGSTTKDIAFCEIPEEAEMEPLKISVAYPGRGEQVAVIGSQFGITNLVTGGNLAGMWESDGVLRLLFTAPVSSGNSGGPVFNSRGELVGIVSGTYDKGQNMNVAVSITEATNIYYNTMDTESES